MSGALLIGLAALAPSCSDETSTPSSSVVVFAAASLTDVFTELGDAFEARHAGVEVTLNFAASSALVSQIVEGAPADVFAAADIDSAKRLFAEGATGGELVVFATNTLAIAVAAGNPRSVHALADLAGDDLVVVACVPEAPCGRYTRQVLDAAGVALTPKSLEENVRGVLARVRAGEADAGIVYATDVLGAPPGVEAVTIPGDVNVVVTYPIVLTQDGAQSADAVAFVQFVASADGRAILDRHGFGAP